MNLIKKCDCDEFTNSKSCKAKREPGTKLYKECIFANITDWKEECKDKNAEETIKFLQNRARDLDFSRMNCCIERIENKWKNRNSNKRKIEKIKKQIKKEIHQINREIKSLRQKKKKKKNKFSPQLK